MKKQTFKTIRFHQGDVIGQSISKLPDNVLKIINKPLALGEVSGHQHVLTGDVELYEIEGRMYAVVGKDGARLQHIHESVMTEQAWTSTRELQKADHNSHLLPEGIYSFHIQQQYNPYSKLMEQVID